MERALKSDQRANNQRARHPADDDQIIVAHVVTPSFGLNMVYLKSSLNSRIC
jgi:hypothetical protein